MVQWTYNCISPKSFVYAMLLFIDLSITITLATHTSAGVACYHHLFILPLYALLLLPHTIASISIPSILHSSIHCHSLFDSHTTSIFASYPASLPHLPYYIVLTVCVRLHPIHDAFVSCECRYYHDHRHTSSSHDDHISIIIIIISRCTAATSTRSICMGWLL